MAVSGMGYEISNDVFLVSTRRLKQLVLENMVEGLQWLQMR